MTNSHASLLPFLLSSSLKALTFSHIVPVSPLEPSNELVIHIYAYFFLLTSSFFRLGPILLPLRIVQRSNYIHSTHSYDTCDFGNITHGSNWQRRRLREHPNIGFSAVYNRLAMRDSSLSGGISINFKASCVSWRVSSLTANVKPDCEGEGNQDP